VSGSDTNPLGYETTAIELIRALRGKRSQNGFSQRIGARSNVVHRWESGACWPTAARFLAACAALGVDVSACYTRMFRRRPDWVARLEPTSPAAVAAFLNELRGKTPIRDVAAAARVNRFTISRWLSGRAQPSLPQFLQLIDAVSRRLPDFASTLVDPRKLPSLRDDWRKLELVRRLAYEEPWSHAVLRALALGEPAGTRDVRFVAERLGLDPMAVRRIVSMLRRAGQVRQTTSGLRAEPLERVDTGADRERGRQLKVAWTRHALQRLEADAPGVYGFSLFEASREDLRKLRALQLEYARAMQAIVAGSRGTECVGLYCASLLDLAAPEHNALRDA
jgi:transcriptional regulator with XRE-family HTH domain